MFTGSMVALITPMTPNGDIDFSALHKLIDWHVDANTTALIIAGTTGEAATLEADEYQKLLASSVAHAAGRIAIIAGTAANGTNQAIARTRLAFQEGVAGCLIMTPAYIKPTQEGLYQHYAAIANAVAIPQILYNVPGRTACDMQAETVIRLAELPHIVGIKEATGNMARAADILRGCGPHFALYSGDDVTALALLMLGGHGVISVTANVAPRAMSALCQAVQQGKFKEAIAINNKLALLHDRLFVEANPIPTKWCLQQLSLISAGIRLPLTPLSSVHHESLRHAMHVAEVL